LSNRLLFTTSEKGIDEKEFPFQIVGIYEMAGNPAEPMVFTNFEYLSVLTNQVGQVSSLRIVTDRSNRGLWLWLIVVLILATLASLLPARNAVRLTVHEVLAYE